MLPILFLRYYKVLLDSQTWVHSVVGVLEVVGVIVIVAEVALVEELLLG